MWFLNRKRKALESTSPPATYKFHSFISYTTREDEVSVLKPFVDEYVSAYCNNSGCGFVQSSTMVGTCKIRCTRPNTSEGN
jgi:hypothetical protein